jgi:hypothetical protein
VVVVDDIIDTGVRLQETVKLLKGAGARQCVNGLCFAFPCGIVYGSIKGFVSYGGFTHVGFLPTLYPSSLPSLSLSRHDVPEFQPQL